VKGDPACQRRAADLAGVALDDEAPLTRGLRGDTGRVECSLQRTVVVGAHECAAAHE
jgi:hypothetical protein